MIRTISIGLVLAEFSQLVAGCATRTAADNASVCEALHPSFPLTFHAGIDGNGGRAGEDTRSTIDGNRRANARFAASCL